MSQLDKIAQSIVKNINTTIKSALKYDDSYDYKIDNKNNIITLIQISNYQLCRFISISFIIFIMNLY